MAKAYFLRGDSYLRHDLDADHVDAGYPKPVSEGWLGLEGSGFQAGVDAAVDLGKGKLYLFKNDLYLRLDLQRNAVDGKVTAIAGAWDGFSKAGFADSLDAAVNWGDGKAYFFKGDRYIKYDIAHDSVCDGYPKTIAGNWPGFERAGFADSLDAAWVKLAPSVTDDRYDRVTFRGRVVDKFTRAALMECERRLGYELTIVQGSYQPGTSQSAGTHDGGGVIDLAPYQHKRKVRVLREVGFAAWYRPTIPGLWAEHVHAVLIGNAKLSSAAARQVASYRAGRDGLKGNAVDDTWRPQPIPTFDYHPARLVSPLPSPNNVTRARDGLVEGMYALDKTAAFLSQPQSGVDTVKAMKADLQALLERLPQR